VKAETRIGLLLTLLLLALNVLSVARPLGFVHKPKQVKERDHYRYIEMARGPEGRQELATESTYCWRILVPGIARGLTRLGLELNQAFYVLTNVSLFGFLFVFWVYLGDLGFSLPYRVAGLSLAGLTQGAVRWYEYQYWMTDPLCLLLIVVALVLGERGWTAALHVPSILGALVRENYAVVYPWYFLRMLRAGRPFLSALARTVAVAALPLAILVGLRIVIDCHPRDDIAESIQETLAFRWRHRDDNQPYVLTVGSLGVLFPLVLLWPARLVAWVREHYDEVAFVAFFYGVLMIANNTERELAYTLPAMVPAALRNLRALVAETGLPAAGVLSLAVVLQAVFFAEQRFLEIGMSMYQPTNLLVVALMAAFWLAAQAAIVLARRKGLRPATPS
jgi:hypothetical protein